MEQPKEPLKKLAQKYQSVLLILLVGVALLAWPTAQEKHPAQEAAQPQSEAVFDLPAFEETLGETLSRIQGVGETEVVLTLSSGGRKVLAEDEQWDESRRERTTVILAQGSGQQAAVTVEVLYPTFQGALVVCDGGGSASVRLAVVQAVKALTGLDADKISVCPRGGT